MSTSPMSKMPRRTAVSGQHGFTLVELVTVIVILGILAAVALPRYADLQGKAREAKVKAVAGSMKAAASLVKATALANGKSCAAAETAVMEGVSIDLQHCYLQALGTFGVGILAAANIESADGWTAPPDGGTTEGAVVTLSLPDAATPSACKVAYMAASATVPPVITTTVTGC